MTDTNARRDVFLNSAVDLSRDVSRDEALAICRRDLSGRTPHEPDAAACARDIAARGYHVHEGVAWGLYRNDARSRPELVRLADYVSTEELQAVGVALFGEQWQAPMSRALGLNVRTVQRWAAGDGGPNPGHLGELKALIHGRRTALDSAEAILGA